MAIIANQFFEERLEQLFNLAALADQIFKAAGVDYQIVAGWRCICMWKRPNRTPGG